MSLSEKPRYADVRKSFVHTIGPPRKCWFRGGGGVVMMLYNFATFRALFLRGGGGVGEGYPSFVDKDYIDICFSTKPGRSNSTNMHVN